MMHDMGDWHWGLGHWGLMSLFWFVVILGIAALVKYIVSNGKSN